MASDTSSAAVTFISQVRYFIAGLMLGNFPYPVETCESGKGELLRCIFLMGWGGGDEIVTIVISYTVIFSGSGLGRNKFSPVCRVSRVSGGGGWVFLIFLAFDIV